MRHHSLVARVAVATLLLGMSACGGSDDEKAEPKPTRTTASPTPTTPVQPKGADGVTYEIQNWDAYADDPAVLAWKQTLEGATGSINARKVLPSMRRGMSQKVLRAYVDTISKARDGDWRVKSVAKVKVESARTTAADSRLVMCLWSPTTVLYEKSGEAVGNPSHDSLFRWSKQTVSLRMSSGHWLITSFDFSGTCSGGEPS